MHGLSSSDGADGEGRRLVHVHERRRTRRSPSCAQGPVRRLRPLGPASCAVLRGGAADMSGQLSAARDTCPQSRATCSQGSVTPSTGRKAESAEKYAHVLSRRSAGGATLPSRGRGPAWRARRSPAHIPPARPRRSWLAARQRASERADATGSATRSALPGVNERVAPGSQRTRGPLQHSEASQ